MISAKDEFFLEREHIKEIASLVEKSDLTHDERENLNLEQLSENEFDQLKRELIDRELKEREAVRRGCTLSAKQINEAVKQAANG